MNQRQKIFYPNEHVFIQMRPELASELGTDGALVFQLFVWLIEGDTRYLLWHENRYWTPQSLSSLRVKYLGKIFRKKSTGDNYEDSGIESKISRILHYLTDVQKVLLKNKYNGAGRDFSADAKTHWYAINYEEVCRLNGVSVMEVADSGERRVFIPNMSASPDTVFGTETDSALFHCETTAGFVVSNSGSVVSNSGSVVSNSGSVVSLGETTTIDNIQNIHNRPKENEISDLKERTKKLLEELDEL